MQLENKEKLVLAVDGDIIAYRTAAVCEDHFEGAAEDIIRNTLREIATDTGVNRMRIYLSGENNFRYKVGKTKPYKGNRATMVRPRFLNHCKDYLVKQYGALVVDGYEADDAIATDMVQYGAIHCGQDKDLFQIAGKHYNYTNKTWREVDEEEATINLYRQVLQGDNSDNVPGLPGVGEKTAENAIMDAVSAHDDAMEFYKEVCAKKMTGVDHVEYFSEQYALIAMVTNLDFMDLLTVHVEHDTQGFQEQEGEEFQDDREAPRL